MRHRTAASTLAALFAVAALLAAASTALAGGWATVTAQNVPVDPPAGQETTISLNMLQHGKTPVSWPKLTVIATDKVSGAVVAAQATASGPEGSYVVRITFPAAGDWTLSYSSPDLMMEGTAAVSVAAPIAAPANTTPAAQTTQAATFDVMPLLAVLAVLVVVGVAWLTQRGRRTPADTRVSAGT
jgi:hypothetical protein